jgi:hypothetical protein
LEFDWSKGIPGTGEGVEWEFLKVFFMNSRNSKIIIVSELLGLFTISVLWPNIYKIIQTVVVFDGMHE